MEGKRPKENKVKNAFKIIIIIFVFAVIVLPIIYFFNEFGCITNWSDLGNFATVVAAFLLFCSIILLVINWKSMIEQNTLLKNQTEDQKRSVDAAVFKTVIDMLQDQDIRQARRHVYEHLKEGKDLKDWTQTDKDRAEKVCYTFDVAATLVNKKLLPESLLNVWDETMMRSWGYVKRLVETYRRDRGWPGLWKDFEDFATRYAVEQKKYLLALKQEEITPTIVRRAEELVNCLKRMGMSDEAKEIMEKPGIKSDKFGEKTT